MSKRLFTFGCSFTSYMWPTWADILGREFDEFQNWGRHGAGNHYIFNSLNECHARNKINENDTVIIMWSSTCREDRYLGEDWLLVGNIYNQKFYNKKFVKDYADDRGFLIRDLAFIQSAKYMLDSIGANNVFTSMVPINSSDTGTSVSDAYDVLSVYQDTINYIRPSVYEKIFNLDWDSRQFPIINPSFELYASMAGPDWPSYDDFLLRKFDNLSEFVVKEMENIIQISQIERNDSHPTPSEHLEYINLVMPEFNISAETKQWVYEIENCVLKKQSIDHLWTPTVIDRL